MAGDYLHIKIKQVLCQFWRVKVSWLSGIRVETGRQAAKSHGMDLSVHSRRVGCACLLRPVESRNRQVSACYRTLGVVRSVRVDHACRNYRWV